MNTDNISVIRAVRMGIALRRLAMRCPAGMTDSAGSFDRASVIRFLGKDMKPAFCFDNLDLSVFIPDGNAGGIISAVFQF